MTFPTTLRPTLLSRTATLSLALIIATVVSSRALDAQARETPRRSSVESRTLEEFRENWNAALERKDLNSLRLLFCNDFVWFSHGAKDDGSAVTSRKDIDAELRLLLLRPVPRIAGRSSFEPIDAREFLQFMGNPPQLSSVTHVYSVSYSGASNSVYVARMGTRFVVVRMRD
jgi:hypothetical protein